MIRADGPTLYSAGLAFLRVLLLWLWMGRGFRTSNWWLEYGQSQSGAALEGLRGWAGVT